MLTTVVVVLAIAIAVVVVIGVVRALRSRPSDGVATFRRQIDALSPEARRPVVDQVQQLEEDADAPKAPPPPPEDDRT